MQNYNLSKNPPAQPQQFQPRQIPPLQQMQPPQRQPVPNRPIKPPRTKGSNKYYYIAIAVVAIIVACFFIYNIFFAGNESPDALQVENGKILDYEIKNGRGYIVMSLEGTHYEIGYAQAELIGKFIARGVNEIKAVVGDDYYQILRDYIDDSVWTHDMEDEFDGMVACLSSTYSSEGIDEIDLKIVNCMGDWYYSFACRSHSCWGQYVSSPIKTISTRRLDFPAAINSLKLHILCARNPSDGSTKWVNLGWPGSVSCVTGVNEYGTVASIHDYPGMTNYFTNSIPRMAACRYVLTYPSSSDISTHLDSVYDELQKYDIMTNTYLNYYVPEGYGGVITCMAPTSYLDENLEGYYDLRVPNYAWHNGEMIVTTNMNTDGSEAPDDEDFGADSYYNVISPKTQESHWDLVADKEVWGNMKLQLFSVAYKDREEMTIWADGQLNGQSRTKRLEYEWSQLFS